MNGIGSDAFAILWDGEKLHGLNASGRSPQAWTRFLEVRQHVDGRMGCGHCAGVRVGVDGAVAAIWPGCHSLTSSSRRFATREMDGSCR